LPSETIGQQDLDLARAAEKPLLAHSAGRHGADEQPGLQSGTGGHPHVSAVLDVGLLDEGDEDTGLTIRSSAVREVKIEGSPVSRSR